ncbi:hypothetical protein HY632_04470 [Candidatus Uhrbacteria bacterium]|nr:hypothetical protein [Candidatus Uhrbacteria bacterium]
MTKTTLTPLAIRGDRLLFALDVLARWQTFSMPSMGERKRIDAIIARCTGSTTSMLHGGYSFRLHVGDSLQWLTPMLRSAPSANALTFDIAALVHDITRRSGWDLTKFFREIASGELAEASFAPADAPTAHPS